MQFYNAALNALDAFVVQNPKSQGRDHMVRAYFKPLRCISTQFLFYAGLAY